MDLHGRVETVVEIDETSVPFRWNHASRSPWSRSRLMTSAEAGSARWGFVYVKGVAAWNEFDTSAQRVRFDFDQGDYVWTRGASLSVRLFANERRYFTSSVGPPLLDDDRIERFDAHGGARADGGVRDALTWSVLGTVLDDASRRMRRVGYAALRWHGARVQGSLAYLADVQSADTLDQHVILEGEVAGFYRGATLIVSYQQSGFDDGAPFWPDGRFDWDGYDGGNLSAAMPEAGSASAEVRVGDLPVGEWGSVQFVNRYRTTGAAFVNDLAAATPGEMSNVTGLFFRQRDVAFDARVVYAVRERWRFASTKTERVEAHAHAILKNGSQVWLRGAVGRREEGDDGRRNENFVHAVLRRYLQKVEVGVHALVKDIDDGGLDRRYAMEARVNWNARASVYGRLVTNEETASNDAAYARIELRPAQHVFVTFGYGRAHVGDGPYLLEDPDIGPTGNSEGVYTITVRGDF